MPVFGSNLSLLESAIYVWPFSCIHLDSRINLMREVIEMQKQTLTITAQAVLSASAFALMVGFAARAVRPQLEPTASAAVMQEVQVVPDRTTVSPNLGKPPQVRDQSARGGDVFTGIVLKRGVEFILRDSSGAIYRLDAPTRVQRFFG